MLISRESLAERLGPAESSAVRKERVRTEAMRGTLRDGGVNPDLIDAAVAASGFVVEEVAESADGIKRAVASTAEQATISFRQVYKDTFTGLDAKKVAKGTVLVAAVYTKHFHDLAHPILSRTSDTAWAITGIFDHIDTISRQAAMPMTRGLTLHLNHAFLLQITHLSI